MSKMVKTTLRLPEALDAEVRELAEDRERSVNKQIIHMLKTQIKADKARTIKEIQSV